jgi:hypothetical protein
MKGVIIATDYLKDNNGDFKILEINTNARIATVATDKYFDINGFNDFITDNGIKHIHLLFNGSTNNGPEYTNDLEMVGDAKYKSFSNIFTTYYSGSTEITFTPHSLSVEAITIPHIEDTDDVLILRMAYDTTALIDDTYCRDNFEFLKLMIDTDTSLVPKTYFVHETLGVDTIGTTIPDNGIYPNFLIKERYPQTNYTFSPIVLKINNVEELESLKVNLGENKLLQEYIINTDDLLNGKLKTYRSVDLIYGENLDVYNLINPFIHTNHCIIDEVVDYDDNNNIQYWERPKFIQKHENRKRDKNLYTSDNTTKVWKSDGTLGSSNELVVGDTLKTVQLQELSTNQSSYALGFWSGSWDSTINSTSMVDTTISKIVSDEKYIWIKELILEDDIILADIDFTSVLIKDIINDIEIVRFEFFDNIQIGYVLVLVDKETEELVTKTVIGVNYYFSKENIYSIDVEEIDVFLSMNEGSSPQYAMIQHNIPQCNYYYCAGYFYYYTSCGPDAGYGNSGDGINESFCNTGAIVYCANGLQQAVGGNCEELPK